MAGRISQTFIDELLTRVDIVDIIDSRVPLKAVGRGEYKACCPFHDEKTPSFTVSSDKQFYHCFGCGEHGTAIGFLMEYAHLTFVEAIEDIASQIGIEIPYEQSHVAKAPADSDNILDLLEQANQFYKQQLRAQSPEAIKAIEYLKNRGLSGDTARTFEVGLALDHWDGLAKALGKDDISLKKLEKAGLVNQRDNGGYYDRFRGRIIFPIHDFKGRVVAFGGRVLGEGEPKYLNSPETPVFHKGSELYNLFRARGAIKNDGFAVVVEGYMDVIALAQFEILNSVATLGTATTRSHLDRLFRYTDEVVFCFDGDKAGERAAWRALENVLPMITDKRQVKFLFLDQGYDPDSLVQEKGKNGFLNLIGQAKTLSEFLLFNLEKQTDLSHLEGRARLMALAKPYLAQLKAGSLKQLLLEQITLMAKTDLSTTTSQLDQPTPSFTNPEYSRRKANSINPPGILSPMAKLISLLLQHPKLNQSSEQIRALTGFKIKGLDVLLALSKVLDENPQLNTAALIERFRETKNHKVLEKLAIQHHLLKDEQLLKTEFEGLLSSLKHDLFDLDRNELMEKAKSGELTEQEVANQLKTLHNQRIKYKDI